MRGRCAASPGPGGSFRPGPRPPLLPRIAMHNVIGLVVLISITALLVWSSLRALRIKSSLLKWSSMGLAALLAAAVSLASALTIAGLHKLHARSAPIPDLSVARTPAQPHPRH